MVYVVALGFMIDLLVTPIAKKNKKEKKQKKNLQVQFQNIHLYLFVVESLLEFESPPFIKTAQHTVYVYGGIVYAHETINHDLCHLLKIELLY